MSGFLCIYPRKQSSFKMLSHTVVTEITRQCAQVWANSYYTRLSCKRIVISAYYCALCGKCKLLGASGLRIVRRFFFSKRPAVRSLADDEAENTERKTAVHRCSYKKLVSKWESERKLSLLRAEAVMRWNARFTKFSEITQCNGHYDVQGDSRSPILVPIESSYATFY